MSGDAVQLALGSVQFGLTYGVVGRGEAVPPSEVREVLALAWESGIRLVDTAPAYGDIEPRLLPLMNMREFEIVSKIPPLPPGASGDAVKSFVVESVWRSVERLGPGLRTLLFHRGDDLLGPEGETAWRAITDTLQGTRIGVGGSFYAPDEAVRARRRFPIGVAQLPGNVLDQRLADAAAGLEGVEIHLRSVLLQGLLVSAPEQAGERVPKALLPLRAWQAWCAQQGVAPLDAALGVARALPRVSHCIVGVDRVSQLREIVTAWDRAAPLRAPALACADEDVIDPRRWKAA